MSMLKCPKDKYVSQTPMIPLQNRDWPSKKIEKAPIWLSTDLRDGNQSLFEPMTIDEKLRMFKMLCEIGYKEIEVGFPAASSIEFAFVRKLIDDNLIPDDVTIGVLSQARAPLIEKTMEAIKGAKSAIVHIYAATSPTFRSVVFRMTKDEVIKMATTAVCLVKKLSKNMPETNVILEFSPETFTGTELEFSKEICEAVCETWEASSENKVILNLPATVELFTPNVYADQIEWMHKNIKNRDHVILSLHPHNDRGTGVAAAELGLLAGADRVEGCLFGHGERTGNVDLVTLALNLYTQGISPKLDFSNMPIIVATVEACTKIPVHARQPYAGDLVFTAFSGSHQDAIKKGFENRKDKKSEVWDMPYLPIDPSDLGRSYDSIIRVNSQSGKGGVAYLLESAYGISLPRKVQIDFSTYVQNHSESKGTELTADNIWEIFKSEYLKENIKLNTYEFCTKSGKLSLKITLPDESTLDIISSGNGPIDAAVRGLKSLGINLTVLSFEESAVAPSARDGDAKACAFVELDIEGGRVVGVGLDRNIVTAGIKAVLSGIARHKC